MSRFIAEIKENGIFTAIVKTKSFMIYRNSGE